jgi:hypothetical protein
MWMVLVAASVAVMTLLWRWRVARPAERLLVLWLVLGIAELIVHDAGNERRYVMFVPVLVALASLTITAAPAVTRGGAETPRWVLIVPALLFAYLVIGSILRMALLGDIRAGQLQLAVRLSTLVSVPLALVAAARWHVVSEWLSRQRPPLKAIALLATVVVGGDLVQYAQWAYARTDYNYQASREIGTLLPEGTLVHGKLANGLSLENRIRPIFVGNGFGNYVDRTTRDDVRYILTYVTPYLGYEGRVIRDVVLAYPGRRVIATFPVAETAAQHDTAALIDKFGGQDAAARQRPRQ